MLEMCNFGGEFERRMKEKIEQLWALVKWVYTCLDADEEEKHTGPLKVIHEI